LDTIELDLATHERVSAHPNRFLVTRGQGMLEIGRAAEMNKAFLLVEKLEAALDEKPRYKVVE
jgi:hypothetical protein